MFSLFFKDFAQIESYLFLCFRNSGTAIFKVKFFSE